MNKTIHRLRGLLIALAILALTAGVTMAGKPSTPASGLSVAAERAGKTVPVRAEEPAEDPEEDVDEDVDEETDEDGEGGSNCATDPTGLDEAARAELRHGQVVCWAAHQDTPDGYDNHGAWVSEWARGDHGKPDEAAAGLAHKAKGKANKP